MSYNELRESLAAAAGGLRARFEAGEAVVELVHARAAIIDEALIGLWSEDIEATGAALVEKPEFPVRPVHQVSFE